MPRGPLVVGLVVGLVAGALLHVRASFEVHDDDAPLRYDEAAPALNASAAVEQRAVPPFSSANNATLKVLCFVPTKDAASEAVNLVYSTWGR